MPCFYCFIMLYAPSMIACCRRTVHCERNLAIPTIPPTTMTMRLTSAMKMTSPTDSWSLHRRIPVFMGFRQQKGWRRLCRLWWHSWWEVWLIWLNFINHANGPFQDHTSCQEKWPYNVLSWLLSTFTLPIQPRPKKHSLHLLIHFLPNFIWYLCTTRSRV